jgi:hypothetical protein
MRGALLAVIFDANETKKRRPSGRRFSGDGDSLYLQEDDEQNDKQDKPKKANSDVHALPLSMSWSACALVITSLTVKSPLPRARSNKRCQLPHLGGTGTPLTRSRRVGLF